MSSHEPGPHDRDHHRDRAPARPAMKPAGTKQFDWIASGKI